MLTEDEQKQLLALLSKLEPGFYPIELFWQFARLMTVATVEFVPFRQVGDDIIEILLLPRATDDVFWPSMMHIPGCVVRPTDTREDVFERIIHVELLGLDIGEPLFVTNHVRKTVRGNEHAAVYGVEVLGQPNVGEFYDAASLPENLIDVYHGLIAQTVNTIKT